MFKRMVKIGVLILLATMSCLCIVAICKSHLKNADKTSADSSGAETNVGVGFDSEETDSREGEQEFLQTSTAESERAEPEGGLEIVNTDSFTLILTDAAFDPEDQTTAVFTLRAENHKDEDMAVAITNLKINGISIYDSCEEELGASEERDIVLNIETAMNIQELSGTVTLAGISGEESYDFSIDLNLVSDSLPDSADEDLRLGDINGANIAYRLYDSIAGEEWFEIPMVFTNEDNASYILVVTGASVNGVGLDPHFSALLEPNSSSLAFVSWSISDIERYGISADDISDVDLTLNIYGDDSQLIGSQTITVDY